MVSRQRAAAVGAGILTLGVFLTGLLTASGAEAQPVARTTCGAFEAVPSALGPAGVPTRLSIQKSGRLLETVSDAAITRVECATFGHGGEPDLLVSSSTGGQRCCGTVRAWALGASPTLVLVYAARSAEGFELRDLDSDGQRELVLGDDSFADFDDLDEASAPARLPLVACRTGAGFQDCTARFPAFLRSAMALYTDRLRAAAPGATPGNLEGAALGILALSELLGEEDHALETIRAAVKSDEVMKWLDRARPKVRAWAESRQRRLKGPKGF
jgi:hypothetical protein